MPTRSLPTRRSQSLRSHQPSPKTASGARRSPLAAEKSSQHRRLDTPHRHKPARPDRAKADQELRGRVEALLSVEIALIGNDSFVGRRDNQDDLSPLALAVELGLETVDRGPSSGLPAHLGRLCETALLTPNDEQELFRRMNYCKYRANALRARLSRTSPDPERLAEAEEYLTRAERVRNHLIQANTRLVMSIARRFADNRNSFDDLLSFGIASLMHSVEKFDYGRGYRFSTYATCAIRRDLYRFVMSRKKDSQRFTTGSDEVLASRGAEEVEESALTERSWEFLTGALGTMLQQLDDRERFIVTHRFGLSGSGKQASYSRLGERLGISKERVRQLANRAMEKLRELAPEHQLETLLA